MDYPDHTPYGICECDACEKNQLRTTIEQQQQRIAELENYGATRDDEMLGATKRIAELERREQYLSWCVSEGEQQLAASQAREAKLREFLPELYTWLSRVQLHDERDEVMAARFGLKIEAALDEVVK